MSDSPDTENVNKTLILAGIRDNLLKPMSEEICGKTESQIRSLRKLVWWGIGIAALSLLVQIAFIIVFLTRK